MSERFGGVVAVVDVRVSALRVVVVSVWVAGGVMASVPALARASPRGLRTYARGWTSDRGEANVDRTDAELTARMRRIHSRDARRELAGPFRQRAVLERPA